MDAMDAPEHANAVLASLLGVHERALIAEIGGPWYEARPDRSEISGLPEHEFSFVGRAGLSAFLAFDAHPAELLVGQAVGTWLDPGTLSWSREEPRASIPVGNAWFEPLAQAVDAACENKRSSLIACRYCGTITGPEFAFGGECCSGCASTYLGIAF